MRSRMSKVLLLVGCLAAAGGASAYERSAVVPVIAGVVVGLLLGSAYADARDDRQRHHYRQPRRAERYVAQPVYPARYSRQVRYVAVPARRDDRHEYRHDRRH